MGASWLGESQGGLAPPDPTGAIGPNSYLQLINLRYGLYNRDGSLIQDGTMATLTGLGADSLSDPQVLWDPGSQRFYYLILDVSRFGYGFGFSKTANPRSSGDFCQYILNFGYASTASLADYPKMAVTQDFVLIGANIFLLESIYNGSDVDWFQKPAANPATNTCPSSLGAGGIFSSLKNADGSLTSTPVPAVNADPSSTGWVVGSADVSGGPASFLSAFRVTRDASGNAVMSGATSIPVASYSVPSDAPQAGTTDVLDTLDTRLEHAVAGVDPRLGATAIWTAHTVFGGAGAEDRWYEISTATNPTLSQSGKVSSSSFFAWNGAISPNRANSGNAGSGGSNMAMGFNTSSSSGYPAIQVVSQLGTGPQSPPVLVRQSLGPNVDFSCTGGSGNVCRWGDYSGAMPDPVASGSGNQVWFSGEWNNPATPAGSATVWQTWNWSATP